MAFDLHQWNPFRFARGSRDTRPADDNAAAAGERQKVETAGSQNQPPAQLPDAQRMLQSIDPFGLLTGLFRSPLSGGGAGAWFGDFSPGPFQPRIDIVDDGDALRLTAELPGVDKQDLEVIVEDGFLVLRGQKRIDEKQEQGGCYRLERAFGNFQRILPLPEGVDLDRAEARFEKGVLTVRLPKKTAGAGDTGRKLEIQ
jgi:HSP20 family protein